MTFEEILDYFREQDLKRIVCWACNNFMRGSGYCAEHSTNGSAYRTNYYKEKPLLKC